MPIAVTRNQIAHLYTALTNHPTLTPGTAAPVPIAASQDHVREP